MTPKDSQVAKSHWREGVNARRDELFAQGFTWAQAVITALEERLDSEWRENQRLWGQQPEATVDA